MIICIDTKNALRSIMDVWKGISSVHFFYFSISHFYDIKKCKVVPAWVKSYPHIPISTVIFIHNLSTGLSTFFIHSLWIIFIHNFIHIFIHRVTHSFSTKLSTTAFQRSGSNLSNFYPLFLSPYYYKS